MRKAAKKKKGIHHTSVLGFGKRMTTEKRIQRTEAGIHNVMSSVCAKASVNPWQEQWSRLKSSRRHYSLCSCNWKMGAIRERGGVCEIISCLFFLICLPRHVSTCQQYARERKKKSIYG